MIAVITARAAGFPWMGSRRLFSLTRFYSWLQSVTPGTEPTRTIANAGDHTD